MSDLRALIEAAKADAPSTAARANVWAGVSTMIGEAAGMAGSAGGAASGTAGAAKMLLLGTLLGGSISVGIGAAILLVGSTPRGPAVSIAAPAPGTGTQWVSLSMPALTPLSARNRAAVAEPTPSPSLAPFTVLVAAPSPARMAGFGSTRRAAPVHTNPTAPVHMNPSPAGTEGDALAREASSLAEARAALARRDALSALQIVRSLRALPARQLIPEELAVEAQALRGLGLDDDASEVEAHLRVRFPDSVLGR